MQASSHCVDHDGGSQLLMCIRCLQGMILYGEPGLGKVLLSKAVTKSNKRHLQRSWGPKTGLQ